MESDNENDESDGLVYDIIASASRMGIGLFELNQFRVADFIRTFNSYVGDKNNKNKKNIKTKSSPKEVEDFLLRG